MLTEKLKKVSVLGLANFVFDILGVNFLIYPSVVLGNIPKETIEILQLYNANKIEIVGITLIDSIPTRKKKYTVFDSPLKKKG